MLARNKIVITLVGRTGDGKSTLGNELLKCLGMKDRQFTEMDTAEAGTRVPKWVECGDVIVVDNPGLMDPSGLVQDKENITSIITKARELGHLNMLVLVMNSQADRFDDGMQSALKLIADSFGRESLNHLFVVFTKCLMRDDAVLGMKIHQQQEMINRRCLTSLSHLTYYAVENHPEKYQTLIGNENVARLQSETRTQLMDLLRAARAQTAFSTAHSRPEEYDHVKSLREAKEAHAREREAHAREREEHARELEAEYRRMKTRATTRAEELAGWLGFLVGVNPLGWWDQLMVVGPILRKMVRECAEMFNGSVSKKSADRIVKFNKPDDRGGVGSWAKVIPVLGYGFGLGWNLAEFDDVGKAFGKIVVEAMFRVRRSGKPVNDETLESELGC